MNKLLGLLTLAIFFVGINGFPAAAQETVSAASLTVTPSASQTTPSPSTTPIPSIIPDWHGLRTPNYTELHIQFTVPLQCGYLALPTGVYGFYSWILTLVMLGCAFATNFKDDKSKGCICCKHYLTMIFFGTMLGLRIAAASVCTKQMPESLVRPQIWDQSEKKWVNDGVVSDSYKTGYFVVTALCAAVGFHLMFDAWYGFQALMLVGGAAVFVPAMFYNSYANFLYIDSSLWKQIITVSIPMAVFGLSLICLFFYKGRSRGYEKVKKSKWTPTSISWTVAGCIFGLGMLFHFWAIGMSFIILGRTINDPWGIKTMWNNFGQVMLVLQGILVPAALYSALFGGSS